jgi:hypothetical protein
MKIRLGFVSNSSSSSFCLLGALISGDRFDELDDRIQESGLEYNFGITNYDSDDVIIGISPSTISKAYRNKTIAKVEEIVQKKLSIIGINGKVEWFVDGGYDG